MKCENCGNLVPRQRTCSVCGKPYCIMCRGTANLLEGELHFNDDFYEIDSSLAYQKHSICANCENRQEEYNTRIEKLVEQFNQDLAQINEQIWGIK